MGPGKVRREFETDTIIGGMVIETCGRVLQSMEIHEWGHDRPRVHPHTIFNELSRAD
jgi:hypothetical protein